MGALKTPSVNLIQTACAVIILSLHQNRDRALALPRKFLIRNGCPPLSPFREKSNPPKAAKNASYPCNYSLPYLMTCALQGLCLGLRKACCWSQCTFYSMYGNCQLVETSTGDRVMGYIYNILDSPWRFTVLPRTVTCTEGQMYTCLSTFLP